MSARQFTANLSRMSTEKMDKEDSRQQSLMGASRFLRRSSTLVSTTSDRDVPKSVIAEQEDLIANCLRDDTDSKRLFPR